MQQQFIAGVIGIILLLSLFGSQLIGRASFLAAETVNVNGESCVLLQPTYAKVMCERSTQTRSTYDVSFISRPVADEQSKAVGSGTGLGSLFATDGNIRYRAVRCGITQNTPVCSVKVHKPEGAGGTFYYRINGQGSWILKDAPGMEELAVTDNLQLGSVIEFAINKAILDNSNPWHMHFDYVPYMLTIEEANGNKQRLSTQTCNIFTEQAMNGREFCISGDGKCSDGLKNTGQGKDISATGSLAFDDWINFFQNNVLAPVDSNRKIVSGKYCQYSATGATLYNLDKVKTSSFACALEVGSIAGQAGCCDGSISANAICKGGSWVPIADDEGNTINAPECTRTAQCREGGNWFTDYATSANDIIREECRSSKCTVIERQAVQCTPPMTGCAQGYVCSATAGYQCVLGQGAMPECGNAVCEEPYEDFDNCRIDCPVPLKKADPLKQLFNFLGVFIAGLIVSAILLLILAFLGPFKWLLADQQRFVLYWLGLAIGMSMLFAVPLGIFAASMGLV